MKTGNVTSSGTIFSGELAKLIEDANKTYGMRMIRPANRLPTWNHISTGVFILDFALHGGLPQGLATTYYGWESSGKTTGALRAVANAQKKFPDKRVVWVDPESTFDPIWAETHGVDTSKLLLASPDSGEQAVDIIDGAAYALETSMIVLDSIPALVPQKLIDDSAEDAMVAVVARLAARMCSKLAQSFLTERKRDHWVTILTINQFRYKIGTFMGDPRVLPGGVQSNYFHTTKVEIKNKETMAKDEKGFEVPDVNEHAFHIKKAKVGASIRNGEFQMVMSRHHASGLPQGSIDDAHTVVAYAKMLGVVEGKPKAFVIPEWDLHFGKTAEIEEALRKDSVLNMWMQQRCIMHNREDKGLPPAPRDNWLVGGKILDASKMRKDRQRIRERPSREED